MAATRIADLSDGVPTKHRSNCRRVFNRYDDHCPRCQELVTGSAPRTGWQAAYYRAKARNQATERVAIAAHFAPGGRHQRGQCGPVCTAFNY